jgi:phenylacetate-coenzyme A ligase PaaK-like adenylate-forming protein
MDTVVSTVEELRALQLDRLRWSLRHAYENVPHYRAAFDAAGVHPDDCRELADLASFPTTGKADLRENYPFGMFAVPQEQVRRIHASSGTTARPGMRRMEKITGRSDDMIILRGVNLFPTQVEEIVLRTPGLSPHFRLVLTTRGRLDRLTVEVEARPDCPGERREPAAAEVAKAVKDTVGVSVGVSVVDPDTLPRSVGKLQRLLDQREKA